MSYIIILSNNCKEILIATLLLFFIYYLINIGNRYVDNNKKLIINRKSIMIILAIILLIGLIYNLINTKSLLSEIILILFYSIIFSYVLNPVINYLERKGIKRALAILIIYLTIIIIIVFIIMAILPKLVDEFENLIDIIPIYIDGIYKVFSELYLKYTSKIETLPKEFNKITNIFSQNLNKIENCILSLLQENTENIMKKMMNSLKLFLVPIISFYLIKDKEYFKNLISNIIPLKYKEDLLKLSKEIDLSLLNFIKCQIITSVIVGILSIIALLLLNIRFSILIGITISLFEIIPYFGPFVGIVLTIIFGLTESLSKAFWGVIALLTIQQIENNIISPKIVGQSVGLHPLIVIIAVIIGGGYFGVLGMILAIPLASISKILFLFFIDRIRRNKH